MPRRSYEYDHEYGLLLRAIDGKIAKLQQARALLREYLGDHHELPYIRREATNNRGMSLAARKKIAAAMKIRWAEKRKAASAKKQPKK